MKNYIATIDLGTNTFHLLIAEIQLNGSFTRVYRERIPVMIGRGGINQGIITSAAEVRAIDALSHFADKLKFYQISIDRVRCTATSAFRNAKNGNQIAARIKQKTNIIIDIIPGELEAEYIYYGVREALSLPPENILIMDIGGGSVELIICNQAEILWKQSFEIGAQRLLDRFNIQDPISQRNINDLREYFSQILSPLEIAVKEYTPEVLVGASGTFDTLSDIYRHRNNIIVEEDASELPLTYDAFQQMLLDFSHMDRDQRLEIPGMIEMRVDMIVPAAWLVQFILTDYRIRNIRISTYALKEGLLTQLAKQFS